jgi:hypothetical protein
VRADGRCSSIADRDGLADSIGRLAPGRIGLPDGIGRLAPGRIGLPDGIGRLASGRIALEDGHRRPESGRFPPSACLRSTDAVVLHSSLRLVVEKNGPCIEAHGLLVAEDDLFIETETLVRGRAGALPRSHCRLSRAHFVLFFADDLRSRKNVHRLDASIGCVD